MERVSKRDLNQSTAWVLDRVSRGDDVVVTEHGTPRWRIVRYQNAESTLARLEREGHYTPSDPAPSDWPPATDEDPYMADDLQKLVDDIRGDH